MYKLNVACWPAVQVLSQIIKTQEAKKVRKEGSKGGRKGRKEGIKKISGEKSAMDESDSRMKGGKKLRLRNPRMEKV